MLDNTWLKLAVVSFTGIIISFAILWGINQFNSTTTNASMNTGYGNQMNGTQMGQQNGMMGQQNQQNGMNNMQNQINNAGGSSGSTGNSGGMDKMDMMGGMM